MEHVIENQTSAVKKVPIRIVHTEGVEEKENCPFLTTVSEPPGGPGVARLGSLGAAGQDSVFCPFTRQRENPEEGGGEGRTTTGARLSEEQKREELARDIMGKDKSLADILDQSKMKTTMDLMEGIFPQGEQLLEGAHQRRKVSPKQTCVARPPEDRCVVLDC